MKCFNLVISLFIGITLVNASPIIGPLLGGLSDSPDSPPPPTSPITPSSWPAKRQTPPASDIECTKETIEETGQVIEICKYVNPQNDPNEFVSPYCEDTEFGQLCAPPGP